MTARHRFSMSRKDALRGSHADEDGPKEGLNNMPEAGVDPVLYCRGRTIPYPGTENNDRILLMVAEF